jgi:hypothetical protein
MPTPRAEALERLRSGAMDLLVIGGGITGARIALGHSIENGGPSRDQPGEIVTITLPFL